MKPRVSLITPTMVGRELSLAHTLVNVLSFQEHWVDEWIIVGGYETSGCPPKIKRIYGDFKADQGRQIALEEATGDIIVQVDDDDWQHPKRIETQVGAILVGSLLVGTTAYYVYDAKTNRISKNSAWGILDAPKFFTGGQIAYLRKPALEVGHGSGNGGDVDFVRRFEAKYGGLRDLKNEKLVVHVRHGKNISDEDWCLGPKEKQSWMPASNLDSWPDWRDFRNVAYHFARNDDAR